MVSKPHRGARKHLRTETATHDNHSPRAAWSRTSLRRSRVPVHASEQINPDFRSAAQNQLRFLKLEDDWKSVPMGEEGRVTHEDYWERITYFLEKTIPSAQEYDVRMACHPSVEALSPIVIRMEFRLAELENPARQHGIRLGQVATRQNAINELKRASIVMRAESYRRRLFSEFDRAKEMFLP